MIAFILTSIVSVGVSVVLPAFLVGWLIGDRLTSGWRKYTALCMPAFLGLYASYATNGIEKWHSRPSLKVSTHKDKGEIQITIETVPSSVKQVTIIYPIVGEVYDMEDLNNRADEATVLQPIKGYKPPDARYFENDPELRIRPLWLGATLKYKVFYESTPGIFVAGTDRYKVSYLWDFRGDILSQTDWRSVTNDQITTPPGVQVKIGSMGTRPFTPEELEKAFKQGPPPE